jgi:hypothetical protein
MRSTQRIAAKPRRDPASPTRSTSRPPNGSAARARASTASWSASLT